MLGWPRAVSRTDGRLQAGQPGQTLLGRALKTTAQAPHLGKLYFFPAQASKSARPGRCFWDNSQLETEVVTRHCPRPGSSGEYGNGNPSPSSARRAGPSPPTAHRIASSEAGTSAPSGAPHRQGNNLHKMFQRINIGDNAVEQIAAAMESSRLGEANGFDMLVKPGARSRASSLKVTGAGYISFR